MMGLDLLADVFNRVRKKRKDLVFLSIKSLTLGMDPPEMGIEAQCKNRIESYFLTLHKRHTPSWLARSRCPGSSPCTLDSNFPEDELDSTLSRELPLRRREQRNHCHNQRTSDTIRKTRSPRSSLSRRMGYTRRGRDADRCHSISPPPLRWLLLRTLCRLSSGCKARLAPRDQSSEDLPVRGRTGGEVRSRQCSTASSHPRNFHR